MKKNEAWKENMTKLSVKKMKRNLRATFVYVRILRKSLSLIQPITKNLTYYCEKIILCQNRNTL